MRGNAVSSNASDIRARIASLVARSRFGSNAALRTESRNVRNGASFITSPSIAPASDCAETCSSVASRRRTSRTSTFPDCSTTPCSMEANR